MSVRDMKIIIWILYLARKTCTIPFVLNKKKINKIKERFYKKDTEKGIRLFFEQSHKGKTVAYADVINKMPAGARDENNNNNNNNVFSTDTYPSPILIPWPHHTRRLYWKDMKSTVVVAMSRDIIRIHLEIFPFAPWELKTEHTPNPNIGRYCCVPVTISTRAFYILQYYYIIIIHG